MTAGDYGIATGCTIYHHQKIARVKFS